MDAGDEKSVESNVHDWLECPILEDETIAV